jgi:adenylate kinase
MIVFFGPPGAGKSVQGQLLAARQGWRWLSTGQLLRDTKDPEIAKILLSGKLLPAQVANDIMSDALMRAKDLNQVILDGFPRMLEQAKWLIDSQPQHGRSISMVIVLEVPISELIKRLEVRGRTDDIPEVIEERLKVYRTEIYPILTYLTEQNVPIVHIDGSGSVGQIHDRIMEELSARKLA